MKQAWVSILMFVCACSAGGEEISVANNALTGPGCDPGRRVGVPSSAGPCPRPAVGSGWTESYLFQQPTVITEGGFPFCLYEYTGSPGAFSTATLPADPVTGTAGVDWTDADCLGIIALSEEATSIVSEPHAQASWAQMGRPDELPQVGPLPATVHVAILDSSVDADPSAEEPTTGEFLHGRAVSLANRDYTCPNGREGVCIPDFDTRLVLDQGGDPSIPGGHYGSIATFARTLEDVIMDAPPDENLVIPLAIGWHPRFNHIDGDISEPEAKTIKAVRAALEYAVCQDVLVLAAAGNRTGSTDTQGLLCPACWEEALIDCDSLRPVVYAVGGLQPDGTPLTVSRENGQPPFAAAAAGISSDNGEEAPLGVWTGTSMGVAHVGAAATLVWGYMPDLTPREVMEWIRTASDTVAEQADVCVDTLRSGACPGVSRVTACGTLQTILSPGTPVCDSHECPEHVPCEAQPSMLPEFGAETIDALLSLANRETVEQSFEYPVDGATCGGPVYGNREPDPTQEYCPWEIDPSYATSPLNVGPQPGSDPCGACAVITQTKPDHVYMAIDPSMVGYLRWPTLSGPAFGNLALSDGMDEPMLVAGDIAAVPLDGLQTNYQGGAQLTFLWSKFVNSTPIQVSVQIPVY